MNKKSLSVRFFLLEVVYFCIASSFSSFAIAYLQAMRGVSNGTVGLLMMLTTIGAFAGQFFFGRLCDYFHTHKKVFFVSCALLVPVSLALYASTHLLAICMLYALFGFVQSPMAMILDTWILGAFPDNPGIYGKIRAGGACAYAACSVTFGRLLETFGYGLMPIMLSGFVALGVALAMTIPDAGETVSLIRRENRRSTKGLFNLPLMLFMGSLLLTGTCGVTYSFLPIMMEKVGGSLSQLGLSYSSSGIAQIPFMFFSGSLKWIPPRVRIAISGMIYFVMALCFAFGDSPAYLIFGAFISGAAYGILLPATRELVAELSTPDTRTTAQGMADAVYLSLSGIIASAAVSATSDTFGMSAPILGIAAFQVVGIIMLLIHGKRRLSPRSRSHKNQCSV